MKKNPVIQRFVAALSYSPAKDIMMNIRNGIISGLSTVAFALAGGLIANPVAAADMGGYIGLAAGQSRANVDRGDIDGTFASLGLTARTSVDETDFGWKLYGGYQFNQYFAVEGGYTDLGKATFNSVITSGGSGTGNGEWTAYSIDLSALGILPLGNQFSLFGRAGVSLWDLDFDFTATGPGGTASASESESGASPLLGIGGMVSITPNFTVRAEFERHFRVGDEDTTGESDIDLISVGLQYRF